MAKDLIIGGASNYTYDQLKYWVNSIQRSGFVGDIVLVATNIKNEDLEKLAAKGVNLYLYGNKNEDGEYRTNHGVPHVHRFFYIHDFLKKNTDYRYVITTDTRDVVFQKNPIVFLDDLLHSGAYDMVISSEGLKYKDEPWGKNNIEQCFGSYFAADLMDKYIYNVGTIAGHYEQVRDLVGLIFQMSLNRPIPIVDQAVYNYLIHNKYCTQKVADLGNATGWAVQLGTTYEAINAGKGDLGWMAKHDKKVMESYLQSYFETDPVFNKDLVCDGNFGKPFYIVHQYDRIPNLEKLIQEKYDDGKKV